MKKTVFPTLIFVLFLLFSATSAVALEPHTTPPDFTLPALAGHPVSLSDFKGHIIILKLATTWCPTCRQEMQEILAAGPELKKAGAVVVSVFVQDTEQMVQDALKGKTFPMEHVALVDDGRVRTAYNVFLLPRVILINRHFKVVLDNSGLMPAARLIKKVKALAKAD